MHACLVVDVIQIRVVCLVRAIIIPPEHIVAALGPVVRIHRVAGRRIGEVELDPAEPVVIGPGTVAGIDAEKLGPVRVEEHCRSLVYAAVGFLPGHLRP